MKEVSEIVERSHALRNELELKSRKIHSVRYGIETASFVGARVWNSLPSDLKQCKSFELFKTKIKNWIPPTNRLRANFQLNMFFFMTVRFRSASTCPVTPGM